MEIQRACAVFAWGAALAAGAGVVTNHWTNADGGGICETNAAGQRVNFDADCIIRTNVMDFALHDGAQVYNDAPKPEQAASFAGMVFHPAANETCPWPTWHLGNQSGAGFRFVKHAELDANPLSVTDGTLVLGNWMVALLPDDGNFLPVRKEGNGTVRASRFYTGGHAGRTLEIADGTVIPMVNNALRYMRVQETSETGRLVFTNYTSDVALGAYEPWQGRSVDARGNNLVLGAMGTTRFPGSVTNYAKLSAVGRSVVVTNLEPGAVYTVSAGRLRLDSKTGAAIPFARYDFEESLTKDSSGHGRDLTASGTVTWGDDPVRGKVARFTATASSGGKLEVNVSGQTELTGDTDYTVSLWAKTAAPPTANNYPTLFSLGSDTKESQLIQFRFTDANCNKLLIGHWCQPGDYSNIAATATPSEWHHYAILREGGEVGMWVDGRRVLRETEQPFTLVLPQTVTITLGKLPTMDRYFAGDIDDVRVYSRSLGEEGVRLLARGEEPGEGGSLAMAGEPLALPSDTRLEVGLNGEIYLAGTQTLAKVYGDAVRGGVVMPKGGELRLTGPGRADTGVAGPANVVKTGGGKLTLGGALTHTGATRVEGGTLALAPLATQPRPVASWDFEDPEQFGADAMCGRINLTAPASGVTRVWDEGRQSHVARYDGTSIMACSSLATTALMGNSDYTISVWAKPASDCPAEGSFFSFGTEGNFQEAVFRYKDVSSGALVLSHWGGAYDFTAISSPANPKGSWHHYAATHKGDVFTVYCDGVQVWTTTKANTQLAFPFEKRFVLGAQLKPEANGWKTRVFKGDFDDVRLYGAALGAADVARLAAGREPTGAEPGVAPAVELPAPVMHYAFEDTSRPGKDSALGANHLKKVGDGTFSFVASPLGGTALQFDRKNLTRLESTNFPSALPAANKPFTVSLWVQTASADSSTTIAQGNTQFPTFISWGNPTEKKIGYMMAYWYSSTDDHGWCTIRDYLRRQGGNNALDLNSEAGVLGLHIAETDMRWHHYAAVYSPSCGFFTYLDGRVSHVAKGAFVNDMCAEGGVFYLGAKPTAPGALFRGALDEVKVFDKALDQDQIRALMRADMGGPHVLPTGARVTVAAGATLEVGGSDESFGALDGAGTLAVDGRVALAGTNTFAGTVVGTGVIALPAGASLTLGSASAAYAGSWDMAPGAEVVPPAGVTAVGGTFRPTGVDAAARAAYPGDVEIADGTAIAVTTANYGPLVAAAGRVTIMGGGSVTLPTAKTTGEWVIARGASVVDAGTGDLNVRWTVANAGANVKPRFAVANGAFVCRVSGAGSIFIVR